MGKVYLIGAGPGDEELLTIKAVRALKECTVVLYDRLAPGNILKYLKDDCKIFYCGKEPGCHYKTQDDINEMLIKLALDGHTVGRIKGGDPYVFGRGSEEALKLLEEKIEFEVIPGITSPISVLNYAGIPITQRGTAQSFHVYTGKSASELSIDWRSAAACGGTLVFLMGLENIEAIVKNLMINSMDENTPCAVVMRGTTSKQRRVSGELRNISHKAREAGFKSPCIIVIGKVIEMANLLNWYEKMPLFGLNICITRSKEQSVEISEKIRGLGGQVTEINSIKMKNTADNLKGVLEKLSEYNYIVFTSSNAVNLFFDYLIEIKYDVRNIKASFVVVGNATESALNGRGIIANLKADEFSGTGVLEKLKDCVKTNDKILLPCSKEASYRLKNGLDEMGCSVDRVHIYEPEIGVLRDRNAFDDVDIVVFTSPSTVKNMIKLVGLDNIKKKTSIAIGNITAGELSLNGIDPIISSECSNAGIIETLRRCKNV